MKKLLTIVIAMMFAGSTGFVFAQAKDAKADKGKAEAKKDEMKKDDKKGGDKGAKK
ncbi:MAG: hypothetical protein ACKVQK_06840 [Burkholderiales bacterium]